MDELNFLEVDSTKLYTTIIGNLMDLCDEALYPGDERRIFGEALALVLVAFFNDANDKTRQRMLRYARGQALDAIGERLQVYRLEPSKASATFRFLVSAAQNENIIIPEGTRITEDGTIYFETTEIAVIPAGGTEIAVIAECTEGGSAYNGMPVGSIATLVDMIPYIHSVSNITASEGGDDGEPYDENGDNKFRERIQLAPSALSTAGPESAYRYFVLSADPEIADVQFVAPEDEPNVLNAYILMKHGGIPDADTLQKVVDTLGDDVRPMTDKFNAYAPEVVEYDINIKYYCTADDEASTVLTIEEDGGSIDQYNEWQTGVLGRDINPDKLRSFLFAPKEGTGAIRADIISPTHTTLNKTQISKFSGNLTVTHEVVSE